MMRDGRGKGGVMRGMGEMDGKWVEKWKRHGKDGKNEVGMR